VPEPNPGVLKPAPGLFLKMNQDCLFCRIVRGEVPAEKIYEDERVLAFQDIHPQAPIHILLIPKKHIGNILALESEDVSLAGEILLRGAEIARQQNWSNFRLVSNNGAQAQQTVYRLHFHLLSGRRMHWPPG
jgi:histidine triad (HIT) family protein